MNGTNCTGATLLALACLATCTPDAHAGDFDGDGRADVLWRHGITGWNTIWRSADPNNRVVLPTVAWETGWWVAAEGDFDGDGASDLLWRNNDGRTAIWRSGNAATQLAMPTVQAAWEVDVIGDFDGDGRDDVFWRHNSRGYNAIWFSANSATSQLMPTVHFDWDAVATGDFDGDGRADLFWRNMRTGANAIWRSGNPATQLTVAGVANFYWYVGGIGDFNRDGRSDVFWREAHTGRNTIWLSGNALTAQATASLYSGYHVAQVDDFDGDGAADVLMRYFTGSVVIWRPGVANTMVPVAPPYTWHVAPHEGQWEPEFW